jgi:cardiolipin synthase
MAMAVLTAANQLTLVRLILVPVFALFMLYRLPGWALVTFAVAGVTDAFDGMIARRTGQQTALGAWLDPMADKLLVATVLVLSRDIAIVLTVAVVNLAVARRTFRPTMLGKLTTVVYVLTGVVMLYANYRGEVLVIVTVAVYASLILTLVSASQYVARVARGFAADDDERSDVRSSKPEARS